jgi:O-methyltransferase
VARRSAASEARRVANSKSDAMPPDFFSGFVRAFHAPVRKMFAALGFDVQYFGRVARGIPDADAYQPRFRPWQPEVWQRRFAPTRGKTLVSDDRLYVLATLLQQALATCPGHAVECGVYRGGTARLLLDTMRATKPDRRLFLCDTFSGMPETDPAADLHRKGDFSDTSLERVRAYLGDAREVSFVPGIIPESLAPLAAERFCFVHVDLDLYSSVIAAARFFYNRVVPGAFLIFDDYGFASTPGARRAVDEFFGDKPETPLALASGQCIVVKAPAG